VADSNRQKKLARNKSLPESRNYMQGAYMTIRFFYVLSFFIFEKFFVLVFVSLYA